MVTPEMKNISIPPFSSPKTFSSELKGMNQYTSTRTPMKVYATRSEVSGRIWFTFIRDRSSRPRPTIAEVTPKRTHSAESV